MTFILCEFFNSIDLNTESDNIQILEIKEESEINKAFSGGSFYLILTDHKFEENICEFEYKGQKVIYRGHSYFTKKRLLSHLANEKYNKEGKNKPHYEVCLKIEDKVNGININKEPYKNWKWTIIIFKMPKSSQLIREQAELAFDEKFKRPIKSKEI